MVVLLPTLLHQFVLKYNLKHPFLVHRDSDDVELVPRDGRRLLIYLVCMFVP